MSHITTYSHRMLGKFLAERYLETAPKRYTLAFLTGCIQPDRNPITYLKGSIRCRLLHGHNWSNSQNYVQRVCKRLEKRKKLGLLDFYTMGKLIHYIVDGFTFTHNDRYNSTISHHRYYEKQLQPHFLAYLESACPRNSAHHLSLPEVIKEYHEEYISKQAGMFHDCIYSIFVSSIVVSTVLSG